MPFLTELDSRAEVKGSRDPLGLMAIWSRFGREVVGNLTTVSGSVRGFTTLLLGLYYAERLQEVARHNRPSALEIFLKFEQLTGYARVKINNDRSVRGLRRIEARLGNRRIRISPSTDHQILSNQKVYGLWGLFSMPARASELLFTGEQRLTPKAREFVERHYVSLLGKRVTELLARDFFDFEPDGRDADLATAVAKVHARRLSAAERPFYRDHLAWGGDTDSTAGRQKLLAELLAGVDAKEFGYPEFQAIRKSAARSPGGEELDTSLERIDGLERLLNPARIAFGFLLTRNGRLLTEVADEINQEWRRPPAVPVERLATMRADIATASWSTSADRWLQIAEAVATRDYLRFLQLLIEANTDVMQKRNGSAPWLTLESGRLRVRMAEETEHLVKVGEVETMWRSTFFINSLWTVSREVSNGQ